MANARVWVGGVLMAVLAGTPTTTATTRKVPHALTVVDAGAFTIQSSTDALVRGEGFEKQGFSPNTRVFSQGQLILVGPATTCANGWTGQAAVQETNGVDSVRYRLDTQLCPTGEAGVYAVSDTFTITGGAGRYQDATGFGLVEGLDDFVTSTYQNLLFGSITY